MTEMYAAQTLIAPRNVQRRDLLSSLGKYVDELGEDGLVIAADAHGRAFHEDAHTTQPATP